MTSAVLRPPTTRFASLGGRIRREGVVGAFFTYARRLERKVLGPWLWLELYWCMVLPWREALSKDASPGTEDFETRVLSPEELARHAAKFPEEISTGFVHGMAARQEICIGVLKDGELVSYCFAAHAPTAIDAHLEVEFGSEWIYIYKAFTAPRWRGRRLLRLCIDEAVRRAKALDARSLAPAGFVCLIASDNLPSSRAFKRAGFRVAGSFPILSICRKPRLLLALGLRHLPFRVKKK